MTGAPRVGLFHKRIRRHCKLNLLLHLPNVFLTSLSVHPPNTRRPTLLNLAPLQANLVALEIPALESYSRGVAALDRAFVLPSPLVIKLIERRLMSSIKVPIAWI
jgi:hypothetical protein